MHTLNIGLARAQSGRGAGFHELLSSARLALEAHARIGKKVKWAEAVYVALTTKLGALARSGGLGLAKFAHHPTNGHAVWRGNIASAASDWNEFDPRWEDDFDPEDLIRPSLRWGVGEGDALLAVLALRARLSQTLAEGWAGPPARVTRGHVADVMNAVGMRLVELDRIDEAEAWFDEANTYDVM